MIYIASNSDAQMRLDRFLREKAGLPNSLINKLIRKRKVFIDSKRCSDSSARLTPNQTIEVRSGAPIVAAPKPEKKAASARFIDLVKASVIYKDDKIIVLNKPRQMAVQGGMNVKESVDDALDELKFDASERPRLVHRLDKATSGLLILARSRLIAQELGRMFAQRLVKKIYVAVLSGVPRERAGVIDAPLTKGRNAPDKEALTHYKVLKTQAGVSLVEFDLKTGRTHQLRLHAALELNCSVVGDEKYGRKQTTWLRLHAHKASFVLDGHRYELSADLPANFFPL